MSETNTQHGTRRSLSRRLIIALLILVTAFASLSLIVHIPAVQNWGIRYLTRYLTEKTGSSVSVKSFDFNVFSHLTFNDVFVSQQASASDTLLYAGELRVRFSKFWKLFGGSPEISRVRVTKARFYVDDRPITLLKLTGEKKSRSAGVRIVDPQIIVDDVLVRFSKRTKSIDQEFFLASGVLQLDEIDTDERSIRLASVQLRHPRVTLTMKPDSLIEKEEVDTVLMTGERIEFDTSQWTYDIGELSLVDGQFYYEQPYDDRPPLASGIDYHDLQISELHLDVQDVRIERGELSGTILDFGFIERSGFRVEHIAAQSVRVSRAGLALGQFEARTPKSTIADTVAIDFGPDKEGTLAERMSIYARFRDTHVAVADILAAIPDLQKSEVFTKNRNEVLSIDGVLRGPWDRLRGDSLFLRFGDVTFAGNFRSRDLPTPGRQVLNLVVNGARFTPEDLEKHIPGVRLSDQFIRLGRIQFQGRFDGFFDDFVAYGNINTDIGLAEVDINLETTPQIAKYSGAMSLREFNLRKWTGIQDLGIVSANLQLRNGSGLTAETAVADISGTVQQFQYKGYTYKDVKVDGRLNQNQFDGKMEIRDPNISMAFVGSIKDQDGTPVFDFTADIDRLDLQKLNLSDEVFVVEGRFIAQGKGIDINSLEGAVQALEMKLVRGTTQYALDTVFLNIEHGQEGRRFIRTSSDYVNGWISGDFELNSLYPSLARFLEETYPQYFSGIKYRKDLSMVSHTAQFSLTLNKPEQWGGLFNLPDVQFKDLSLNGIMNFDRDSVIVSLSAPQLSYRNVNAYEVTAHLESIDSEARAETNVTVVDINEEYFFDEITASVRTIDQGFAWTLAADDLLEELNTLGLSGTFIADTNQKYTMHIDPEIIEVLDQQWELREGNRIRFGKDFIELRDIVFKHEDQVVTVTDVNRRGVLIETQHFDLSIIDDLWDYQKLDFSGPYTLRAELSDIFNKSGFNLLLDAPEVLINGDAYGNLRINSVMDTLGALVSVYVGLEREGIHLTAGGSYYPPLKEVPEERRDVIDLEIHLDTFPIAFLEYFLKDGIVNTTGYAVGDVYISGPLKSAEMDGSAVVMGGATTVAYLGTRYFIDKQEVRITESVIDATGATLTDESGNVAYITGGLRHQRLANLALNARIQSPRIMALKTTKADNSIYYGRGIGSINAMFSGLLERPSISVDATTDQGTEIVIDLTGDVAAESKSFVHFRNDETDKSIENRGTVITGVNFEMNLTATPNATVEIILEDDPPESIIGTGTGDIQMSITRSGDFTVYGQYEIEDGNYLFRSFFVINKPFELIRGGTIQWTGDPYNAHINIAADYVGLRASLSTLLAEYLPEGSEVKREAATKTDVQLRLLLTGTLLEPEINFDLFFPNLTGELAGYADTKLRVLKSNQNAMNEQVFGLLWAGSFLPSNILQSQSSIVGEGLSNTMNEFVSGYISSVFSSVVSRWVGSDVDLNVSYSRASRFDYPELEGSSTYRELEFRVKNRLFNDRVILDAGANYSIDNPISGGSYFVGDYALEYLLTKDGRFKIRFYHRNELTIEGRKNKVGIGLAWRREFDSFQEWLGGMKKDVEKLEQVEGPEASR